MFFNHKSLVQSLFFQIITLRTMWSPAIFSEEKSIEQIDITKKKKKAIITPSFSLILVGFKDDDPTGIFRKNSC